MSFLDLTNALSSNTNGVSSTGVKQLQYPSDLFSEGNEAFIMFTIKDSVARGAATKSMIALYMPPELSATHTAEWETYNIQVLHYADMARQGKGFATDAMNSWDDFSKAGVTAIERGLIVGTDTMTGTTFDTDRDLYLGRTVNPHMAQLYKGAKFRQFSLTFQMMARNETESKAIYDIIKEFKLAMSPSLRSDEQYRYWNYPDDLYIDLRTPQIDTMFRFATSVIKDVVVDYGSNGIQSFFNGDGRPVDVSMKITFEEKMVLTKEFIEKGF